MGDKETEKEKAFKRGQYDRESDAVLDVALHGAKVKEARSRLETKGMAEGFSLGIPESHTRRIVDKVLKQFDEDFGLTAEQAVEAL